MQELEVINILKKQLNFSDSAVDKIKIYINLLFKENKKHNLISKSTENIVWSRHILDSAQIVKYIDLKNPHNIADFGSGAGLPGVLLSLFSNDYKFHVKLYEKSPVKRDFLNKIKTELDLKYDVFDNIYNHTIDSDIIVCRAFKKIEEIIKISREIIEKSHQIIILKGKNAEKEIKGVSLPDNCSYKFEESMSDKNSKILIMSVVK